MSYLPGASAEDLFATRQPILGSVMSCHVCRLLTEWGAASQRSLHCETGDYRRALPRSRVDAPLFLALRANCVERP